MAKEQGFLDGHAGGCHDADGLRAIRFGRFSKNAGRSRDGLVPVRFDQFAAFSHHRLFETVRVHG